MHVGHQKNGRFHDTSARGQSSPEKAVASPMRAKAPGDFGHPKCQYSFALYVERVRFHSHEHTACAVAQNFLGSLLKLPSRAAVQSLIQHKMHAAIWWHGSCSHTKVSEVEKDGEAMSLGFTGVRALTGLLPLLTATALFVSPPSLTGRYRLTNTALMSAGAADFCAKAQHCRAASPEFIGPD